MRKTLFAALVLAFTGAVAGADEVRLISGETLTVTDVKTDGTKVSMVHPVLGRLEVPATHVTEIKRNDGTKLAGTGPASVAIANGAFRATVHVTGQ